MSLVERLNVIFRNDEFINEISRVSELEKEEAKAFIKSVRDNLFFDSMTWGIELWQKELQLNFTSTMTDAEKISSIKSKMRSTGKASEELIKRICDSWNNGSVNVDFVDGQIQLEFIDIGGIPSDLNSLEERIEEVKPAHLAINYIFKWLTWSMWDSWNINWDEFDGLNLSWDELETTVINPI